MLGSLLGPDIQELLDAKRLRELREVLTDDLPPYDIADLIDDLTTEDRAIVFRILPRSLATDVFEEMSVEAQRRLLESLTQEQCRRIIEEMDPDDRTSLLEELPARVTRKLLRLLSSEERIIAKTLLAYPDQSVGRLMTPDYIELRPGMSVGEAIMHVREVGLDKETIYVCYVTGPGHVIEGVVGLRRLVLADPEMPVRELMYDPVAVAHTHDDREEAARAMRDYDLLALPVLDEGERLVGIVTIDDIVDVIQDEATEDFQVMAGILPQTERGYLDQPLWSMGWRRGVPLLGLLFGQAAAGLVLRNFHESLAAVIALTFFIPMVMATGGGMGIQTSTLIVRGFSTGEILPRNFLRLLGREILVCLILGIGLGVVAFGLSWLMLSHGEYGQVQVADFAARVGLTVSGTLIFVMLFSVTMGTVLPVAFQFFKLDPAVMTSPVLTTAVDVVGLLIYFEVASLLFRI